MEAASLLTPNSHYQSPYPVYSTYATPSSGSSLTSSTISSPEPHRAPDENNTKAPARQSLPSISQVISGARPGQYPPPHNSLPPQPGSGGLPSPFAAPFRQYNDWDKHSPGKPDGPGHGHVHHDHRSVSGGYPQPPAPTSHPYQPAHLPPSQTLLPTHPISPRHEHYDAPRPQTHGEPAPDARSRYEAAPRHYENCTYRECFARIGSNSRTLFTFADSYSCTVQEQQGGHHAVERLPSEREVSEMLANVDDIKRSLEKVCDDVQHTERALEGAKAKRAYEEGHDVNLYHNDGMKPHYPVTEVKKRRGRAAPPGRCHSCNRIDTPEWRRGPDGARTLCNACGLHYAKMERKRQMENQPLRPKEEERN